MTGVNFLGSASGLPLNELVNTLVKTERDAKLSRITSTRSKLESSLSGVGRLKSALSGFRDAVTQLSTNNLNARKATVIQPTDNKTYLEASASSRAVVANFDIRVQQLASGSRLESADGAFSSANDVIATSDGTLTFAAGDKTFEVAVTAGMTLNQLRQAINSNGDNFGVNANIINAGGAVGSKLVLTSNISGDGNDLVITNNNAELDPLSSGASGLTVVTPAQNAIIEVDGITATSATNTFTNVIQEIELKVLEVTPAGNNARLNIEMDSAGTKEKVENFIKKYNELVDQVTALTRPRTLGSDGKTVTNEGGALTGDSLPRNIMSQLRGILGANFTDADEGFSTLYAMGITFDKSGKLEISTSTAFGADSGKQRFEKALSQNFDSIANLFGGDNGISKKLDSFISEFTQSGGIIASREQTLRSQIDKSTKDLAAANRYIDSYEQTLRARYTALDSLLGSMQNLASTVTAQLTNLPGFTLKKSR
ncbi:MAG: flagellar filament capping protein FliD [Alishewanella aestuarii]